MHGKCLKCDHLLTHVSIGEITVEAGLGMKSWNGVAYLCPFCHTILSVAIDPIALKTDTVNEVLHGLR